MEKGPAIHGNDLKDLRSGISAIRRKLDSQKIIDEVNIERLGITVGKEVRRMERNFLSSSAAALLVAPILPFILHSFCGFSWWLCGTFGLLEALAAIDFYCKYRRLHKIDFAGTVLVPQYKAQSRAIDNFCAQVEEFSRKEDEAPKQ